MNCCGGNKNHDEKNSCEGHQNQSSANTWIVIIAVVLAVVAVAGLLLKWV